MNQIPLVAVHDGYSLSYHPKAYQGAIHKDGKLISYVFYILFENYPHYSDVEDIPNDTINYFDAMVKDFQLGLMI